MGTTTDILISAIALLASITTQFEELKEQVRIEEEKKQHQEMVQYIMQCESQGNPNAVNWKDALITGHPSRGLFQFQWYTFLSYGTSYGILPKNLTIDNIVPYMHNPRYNAAIAEAMLADGLHGHWRNCYSRYRLTLR